MVAVRVEMVRLAPGASAVGRAVAIGSKAVASVPVVWLPHCRGDWCSG